jgi:RNA polymerase sigma-70 factor (ECF subfamily)
LLKILSNLDSFAGRSKFTTWAHKITVRVALTELRRKSWKDRSLDDMLSAETPFSRPFAANAPTPERATERADMMMHLQRVIEEELTPKQREVMLLVPISGMPMSEAADRMGIKRNAMYKLLHDARLRLKKRLEAEGLSADDIMTTFRS